MTFNGIESGRADFSVIRGAPALSSSALAFQLTGFDPETVESLPLSACFGLATNGFTTLMLSSTNARFRSKKAHLAGLLYDSHVASPL
jgi:hypothetical protein